MKNHINKLFVLLAIVMSFVAVQSLSAEGGKDCDIPVEGEILEILSNGAILVYDYNSIEEKEVYGIPLIYLANQLINDLIEGNVVSIDAIYKNERLEACTLERCVDDVCVIIDLPGARGLDFE